MYALVLVWLNLCFRNLRITDDKCASERMLEFNLENGNCRRFNNTAMPANSRQLFSDLHPATRNVLCTMHDIKIRTPTMSWTWYNVILVLLGRQPSHVATICTAQHKSGLIVPLTLQSIHALNAWTHKFFTKACIFSRTVAIEKQDHLWYWVRHFHTLRNYSEADFAALLSLAFDQQEAIDSLHCVLWYPER